MLDRHASSFVEGRGGEVELDDASPDAVAAFLEVLATGNLGRSDFRRHCLDLHRLADKYNVSTLAAAAENEAAEAAAASDRGRRCVATLRAAALHGSAAMWSAAAGSLARNMSDVLGSEEWAQLEEEQPELARQVKSEVL